MNMDRKEALNRYLSSDIKSVQGWCIPQIWQCIWPLYNLIGDGPVAEIGVFHGKYFIGLAKTFGPEAKHLAIDLFSLQTLNIDGSGRGDLNIFKENLHKFEINKDNIMFEERNSLTLDNNDAKKFIDIYKGFHFFSVDGCHDVAETVNDIEFAMATTHPDGIITVDDYSNQNWPGVSEAVAKMYLLRDFHFVPLLVVGNKLFLCLKTNLNKYRNHVENYISENFPNTKIKKVTRFGYENITVNPDLQKWTDL